MKSQSQLAIRGNWSLTDYNPNSDDKASGAPIFGAIGLGVYLAFMQFAYFFLLEAYYSSRAATYFIALFFWLGGFLVGLAKDKAFSFQRMLVVSCVVYYAVLWLNTHFPFKTSSLLAVAGAVFISGICPGLFFAKQFASQEETRRVLFHENNGFVLGVVLCLYAILFHGFYFLYFAPIVGLLLTLPFFKNKKGGGE